MFALERQKKILELLRDEGAVWVSKLSQELDVTEETVRRDLEKLEKQEMLLRTHGGAIPIDESNHEMSLEKRKNLNVDSKMKLAKEAVKYIHNPKSDLTLKQALAYLKYEELFLFMLKMNSLKRNKKNKIGLSRCVDKKLVTDFINTLPFKLTEDQSKCVDKIYDDLKRV